MGCSVGEYVEGSYVGAYVGGLEGLAAKHTIRVGLADALGERETEGAVDGIVSSIQPLELLLPLLLILLLDFDEVPLLLEREYK